jgi:hypothetical protein
MYGKKIKVKGKNPLMSKMDGGPRGRSVSKTVAPMRRISLGVGQIGGGGDRRK